MVNVVGNQITKLEASKKEVKERVTELNFNIKTKVDKVEVKRKLENDVSLVSAKYSLVIDYVFKKKSIANITFEGEMLFAYSQDAAEKLVKEWKKSKKLERGMAAAVNKIGFEQCLVEAINVARMLKLPNPIPIGNLFRKQ